MTDIYIYIQKAILLLPALLFVARTSSSQTCTGKLCECLRARVMIIKIATHSYIHETSKTCEDEFFEFLQKKNSKRRENF